MMKLFARDRANTCIMHVLIQDTPIILYYNIVGSCNFGGIHEDQDEDLRASHRKFCYC